MKRGVIGIMMIALIVFVLALLARTPKAIPPVCLRESSRSILVGTERRNGESVPIYVETKVCDKRVST